LLDRASSGAIAATNEFHRAVYDHLRRIWTSALGKHIDIAALPFSPVCRGEWIAPTKLVPVVDVLLQGDNLGSGYRLLNLQITEKCFGWRAAGAALVSKLSVQHWCAWFFWSCAPEGTSRSDDCYSYENDADNNLPHSFLSIWFSDAVTVESDSIQRHNHYNG